MNTQGRGNHERKGPGVWMSVLAQSSVQNGIKQDRISWDEMPVSKEREGAGEAGRAHWLQCKSLTPGEEGGREGWVEVS